MIQVDCYNCGSSRRSFYATANGFTVVKCSVCGLLFVTPRPSQGEIEKAHQLGFHKGQSGLDVTGRFCKGTVRSFRRKLEYLYQQGVGRETSTWLDIGCGHGEFLVALEAFGNGRVLVEGLEPNRKKQRSARQKGLNVSCFELNSHQQEYEFISLLNVWSHLRDPLEFLKLCRKVLKPGGELLLRTGDTSNLPAEEHPRPFLLPDHLSFASEEIVSDVLGRCGFDVVAVDKFPAYDFGTVRLLKECIKLVWPRKRSQLLDLPRQWRVTRRHKTDIWVRATMAR